jgi:predicted protein tyrosine phosphatase
MLGYHTMGAPKGENYLFVRKGDHAAMNLIDVDDPQFISDDMLKKGIEFAKEMYAKGKPILIHCNAGHSRGPTTAMMFMRSIGELPQPFNRAKKIFSTLYPSFNPGHGMEFHARKLWNELGQDAL